MRVETQDQPAANSVSADTRREFQALASACGAYRLDRAHIALTGSDRMRWLNGMVTNNVRDLAAGHGVYAFLLNPQGKIQADLYAFNRGEDLIVETDRAQVEKILEIFDHYIIMDDVEVANLGGKLAAVGIAGPRSGEILTRLGFTHELNPLQITDWKHENMAGTIVRMDNPCVPNYEIWAPPNQAGETVKVLVKAGAAEIHAETLDVFRIACGIPKYGQDIRERDLPQETGQERALNFNKGCYVGQEIVERIRSRGAVHRALAGFEIEGTVSPGARIQNEGKDIGEITSIATVPSGTGERVLALGYLRKEFIAPDKELRVGEASVRVVTLPLNRVFS